ncbi:MAG: hypothetical protein HY912_15710 [Desulfomonile tiedjei]|uniref:ParB-like N-terminal domain-containing protein n=1 Tax=Desulfomonile tiedjei TaxID=2358 RepID=A0A9D6Z4F5_9BACT|nr:hypothetical protein [Desulfomonile tiedjei]
MNWLNHSTPMIVDPRSVDLEDRTYLIPCYSNLSALTKSIQRIGILNSPLVQQLADGRMIPVAGRRRLQSTVALGLDHIHVRLLPEAVPIAEGFALAFWDNAAHRVFDIACTAVVIRRVFELFPRDVAARDFLPILGIALKGPRLERLRAIGGLESSLLEAFSHGRIHEKTAALLCEMEAETRLGLLDLTEKLRLNANKKAEIISWLFDLSVLEATPISELLAREEAKSIIFECDGTVPERAERFRELIRSWKFPELIARENEFRDWVRGQSLLEKMSVQPTTSFEDPGCVIEIRTDSTDEAERIVSAVKQHARPNQ